MIVGETVENMDSPMPTKILDVRKRLYVCVNEPAKLERPQKMIPIPMMFLNRNELIFNVRIKLFITCFILSRESIAQISDKR